MGFVEIFLIGIGLSMDAFAVALCNGLKMDKLKISNMLIIALFFGGFQALMPLIGYFLGSQFEEYITNIDHYIAFALLLFIGGKMIYDSFKSEDESCEQSDGKIDYKELTLMAVATSIDALAVGITLAFLQVKIVLAVTTIGVTTFSLSAVGVYIGHKFGAKFKNKAEIAGGIVLILIGTKILLEHLGVIQF